MKMRSRRLISLISALALMLSEFSGLTVFAGGGILGQETVYDEAGQPINVQLIEDIEDFSAYKTNPAAYPYVKLSSNIDISALCSGDSGMGWEPIGNEQYSAFNGVFDGNGHTISGFSMDAASTGGAIAGLFGYNAGMIKNLTVQGTVAGAQTYGNRGVGGICAVNDGGIIENCVNEVTVTGFERVGGVCGCNNGGSYGNPDAVTGIINCVNKAAVTGGNEVGGICGHNDTGANVNVCRNDGAVTAAFEGGAQYLGGICGYNEGNIRNSFNTATLGNTSDSGEVINGLGGICGSNNSGISYCFNVGRFAAVEAAGGICGNNSGSIDYTYYLKEEGDSFNGILGIDDSDGITALTAEEFASGVAAYAFKDAPISEPAMGEEPTDTEFWGQTLNRDAYPVITTDESKKVLKVTFYAGNKGNDEYSAAYANKGKTVVLPSEPEAGNSYRFAGWSTSKTGTLSNNFNGATVIENDTSVYAIREEKYGADYAQEIKITNYDGAQSSYNLAQYISFAGTTSSAANFNYAIVQGKSGNMQNADISGDSLIIPAGVPAGTYTFLIKASVKSGSNISLYSVDFGTSDVYLMITFEIAGSSDIPTQAATPKNIVPDYINETLINKPETEGGFVTGQAYRIKYSDSNNIDVIRPYVYSGSPIAIAEDWFGKTISIIRVGTGGETDSEALKLQIIRPNAPNSIETKAETSEGTGGKITGTDNNMEYRKSDETSWHECGNEVTGLSAGTYFVRYKAVENEKFASQTAQAVISAYAAPETRVDAPTVVINYANESIKITNYEIGAEYTVGGNAITLNSKKEWPIPAIAAAPGGSYGLTIVRVSHSEAAANSEPVNITIPARPAAPTGLSADDETEADKNDGKITGTSSAMEYRKSAEEEWTSCPDADMAGLAPGTYYIRYKSTSTDFASLAEAFAVNAGTEPTSAPTLKPVTEPTSEPTSAPTSRPVTEPTSEPTSAPTSRPVTEPTSEPTSVPTSRPVTEPTSEPTSAPTSKPVTEPTSEPSVPTSKPVTEPTSEPTVTPIQTAAPTDKPTQTIVPTVAPSPTVIPSQTPGITPAPTVTPDITPTTVPTAAPTLTPMITPTPVVTPAPFEWNIKKTSSSITVEEPSDGFKYTVMKDGKELSDWKTPDNGKDITFSGLKSNTTYVVKARSVSDPAVEYTIEVKTSTSGGSGGGGSAPAKKTPTPKPAATPEAEATSAPESEKTPEPSKMPAEQTPEDKPFTDISEEDWFEEDVLWANSNGIMTGILQTEFVPDMPLTRGMLAAILGRMENVKRQSGKTPFTDVDETMYYAPYIAWAYENGILHGMDDDIYCPDENITREQMAVAIKNYAEYKGRSAELSELDYIDTDRISDWAKESVAYCKAAGYMFGRSDGSFDPKAGLTRAECAAVIRRLY